MIEKLDYELTVGRPVQAALIDKINEIINHLNAVHGEGQSHIMLVPPTPQGWSMSDTLPTQKEGHEDETPRGRSRSDEPLKCLICGRKITYSRIYGDPRFCCDQCQDEYKEKGNDVSIP